MDKIIVVIHFNTPELTSCLIRSINKFVDNAIIYLFDNSDKKPFRENFENVIIINNTKGQIIDFDKWLEKYPNRLKSGGMKNKWASAKHAYTIEKCMDIIKKPFILLDSDILLKKDVSELFREDVAYCGEIINQPGSSIKRVLPFVCMLNTPMIRENGLSYFNENLMHGLNNSPGGDNYDTGASFYLSAKNLKHLDIKWSDYAVHYGHGSWNKSGNANRLSPRQWLERNGQLWSENAKKENAAKPKKVDSAANRSNAANAGLKKRKPLPERNRLSMGGNQLNYY